MSFGPLRVGGPYSNLIFVTVAPLEPLLCSDSAACLRVTRRNDDAASITTADVVSAGHRHHVIEATAREGADRHRWRREGVFDGLARIVLTRVDVADLIDWTLYLPRRDESSNPTRQGRHPEEA